MRELPGPCVGGFYLRSCRAFDRSKCGAQGNLQTKFLLHPLSRLGQRFQQVQSGIEMGDCLTMSRSLDRLLPGELKVLDGFFGIAATTVVVGEVRGVFIELKLEEFLYSLRHSLVQLPAAL